MSEGGGKQQNTAYGVFVQACWAQHKRQYPDELIHKEIEEFNKQCSVWWYNLSEQERERFQEMADRSNSTAAQGGVAVVTTSGQQQQQQQQQHLGYTTQNVSSSSSIPSFGSSFAYSEYGGTAGGLGGGGQVVNAVVDNSGTVINYSTGGQQIITTQGRVVQRPIQQQQQQIHLQHGGQHPHQAAQVVHHAAVGKTHHGKPMKDPNAPKKPLSAYFLFSQEERLKVKAEYADYSITEVAKELGRRWATIDPAVKQTYEQRYQGSRRQYEQAMAAYKPTKKKKDPNAPKQPLSAYFIFSSEERLKVKGEHPSYSICEVAKELGRRWADMSPDVKQRYQQMAEEGRQKYDQDMAAYRQGNYTPPGAGGETRVLGTNAAVESLSTATTQPVDGLREDNNTNSAATITGVAPEDKQVVVPPGGNPSAEAANNVVEAARTPVSTASAEATSYAGMENANDYSSLLQ